MLDRWGVVLFNFSLKGLALSRCNPRWTACAPYDADGGGRLGRFQLSQDDRRIRVEVHGKLTFTEDKRGIASLKRGTRVQLEEDEAGGIQRRLDIEPAGGWQPRLYLEDQW